jgi:hypothetical protein
MATRYFFDFISKGQLVTDIEGMVLPDIEAARREASGALADLARDVARSQSDPSFAFEVRTFNGPAFNAALPWNLGPNR